MDVFRGAALTAASDPEQPVGPSHEPAEKRPFDFQRERIPPKQNQAAALCARPRTPRTALYPN